MRVFAACWCAASCCEIVCACASYSSCACTRSLLCSRCTLSSFSAPSRCASTNSCVSFSPSFTNLFRSFCAIVNASLKLVQVTRLLCFCFSASSVFACSILNIMRTASSDAATLPSNSSDTVCILPNTSYTRTISCSATCRSISRSCSNVCTCSLNRSTSTRSSPSSAFAPSDAMCNTRNASCSVANSPHLASNSISTVATCDACSVRTTRNASS
mmetsp:Transcript_86099/g.139646  ORF Transcript_86099/g.139646 Transcript_86099/m.139646 type:complete len:215 (-) Transcript_86099:476-1120(-)